jgi:hypothetical protein
LMTVRYGQHASRALLQWCDKTLAELNRLAKRGSERRYPSARRRSREGRAGKRSS